ncbi:MAG: lamin tail domain-containing protein [Candidatus Paceibacterota bacterium]|jgi:hypothetical protein
MPAVTISELLPNPAGSDTAGEWIELHNTGDVAQSLAGWSLKDASGKTHVFKTESMPAHGFLVLPYSTTKISLNNSGDTIFLYDGSGTLVDSFSYAQTMKDDVALVHNVSGNIVVTTQPTPGKENVIVATAPKQKASPLASSVGGAFSESIIPSLGGGEAAVAQTIIDDGTTAFSVAGLALLIGIICAGATVFLYRKLFQETAL